MSLPHRFATNGPTACESPRDSRFGLRRPNSPTIQDRRRPRRSYNLSWRPTALLLLFSGLSLGFLFLAPLPAGAFDDLTLWYTRPAEAWTEGLPIGNGRLLAVVQGGIDRETVQLNEDTLWTGQPIQRDKIGAAKYLPKVRQLMFDGQYYEAERLVEEKMLGLRLEFGMHTYQTLGDLTLAFRYPRKMPVRDYRRELDLDTAITRVRYTIGNATYRREAFSSPVDQALVMRFTCDEPGQISFDATLSRHKARIEAVSADRVIMTGIATGKTVAGWRGVKYEAQLQVSAENGRISSIKKGIRVEGADAVTILLVAATNYQGHDPHEVCQNQLAAAAAKTYAELRRAHIAEHQRLFRRVDVNFGRSDAAERPTDERLDALAEGEEDPQLVELYFQFGRYILITASRPGSQAINLWGKWVKSLDPSYNADYHININIQMNYWPAEVCNLAECHEPFFDLLDALRPRGRITAQETYGCRGFVAHHATDAWHFTAAIGNPPYGMWPMAPAWMCHHLWDHYLFGGDREYLAQRSYPIMREAAEFLVDYLVEDPDTGYLVSGPSTSPENRFIAPDGHVVSLSMAPAMDIQLINDLFSNCIEAGELLGVDDSFRRKLQTLRRQLPPLKIGTDGRLMEWSHAFQEQNPGHRHISHLWGLCPGHLITKDGTPDLFEAARRSLEVRVANGAAASPEYRGITAWVTNAYVRLGDGDKAYGQLRDILAESSWPNLFAVGVRGREREMFETDANLGCCAAIAEMLLQSHAGSIRLLPALPTALPNGSVTGLRVRGAFEVDLAWSDHRLQQVHVRSLRGNPCRIICGDKRIEFETVAGREYCFDGDLQEYLQP